MTAAWTLADLPDQSGRTVLVTGANSGLGLSVSSALAGAGAHVVLAVRDVDRGRQAAAGLGGSTEVAELDLADLGSVRRFAAGWDRPLDVLVNNAGIMAVPFGLTADGFERQLGTNHLGHFALTTLLLPRVTDRVVTVSSILHRRGTIDLDDLNWERRRYDPWAAYGQSKLANLLFTLELQRRLLHDGSPVRALAAHPGYAATNLQAHSTGPAGHPVGRIANRLVAQPAEMGALPLLFAAVEDVPGASFVGPDGRGGVRGHPALVSRSAEASDVQLAQRLWEASERLTGTAYPGLV